MMLATHLSNVGGNRSNRSRNIAVAGVVGSQEVTVDIANAGWMAVVSVSSFELCLHPL
jgi:hypothetical protein